MRKILRLVSVLGVAALAVLVGAWLKELTPLSIYVNGQVPPGQSAYMGMRVVGLMGLILIWAQLCMGILFAAFPAEDAALRAQVSRLHQTVGLFALVLVASHPALFMLGVYLRTQHIPWNYLVPIFDQGFYNGAISLGVIALYLLLVGSAAAILRNRPLVRRNWTKVHWINAAVLVLATVHCLLIGGETRLLAVELALGLLGATLIAAIMQRIRAGRR